MSEHEFESPEEVNAFLQDVLASGQPPSPRARTPVQQAQNIMYEAWGAQGARRVRLARKALTVSLDCADAYNLLAEETAKSVAEAKTLYEQGVAAGERALGAQFFEENVGHFWGLIEARPYMRAREGLASCLYILGQREEAAAHYQEMMRLNPDDNQGIRYFLSNLLLELRRYDELAALLDAYSEEERTALVYARALATFEQHGATETAAALLKKAIQVNPYVPDFLLGKKRLPRNLPSYVSWGGEDEAAHYAEGAETTWGRNPKALAWLAEV